jgi:hypothetical protein
MMLSAILPIPTLHCPHRIASFRKRLAEAPRRRMLQACAIPPP